MTNDYWQYARDVLAYPEIQQPGPLALLAEAEAREHDLLFGLGEKLRAQFLPALAENESVKFHGQSRGVPRHKNESDEQYRLRVINAFAWQKLAGRHHGMYKIFAEYGFPIIDMRYLSGDRWAEFDIEIESPIGQGLGEDIFDLILWLIFEYKRASAMLRTMRLVKRVRGRIRLKTAVLIGERHTVFPPPPELPVIVTPLNVGLVPLTHESWTVQPRPVPKLKKFKRPDQVALEYAL